MLELLSMLRPLTTWQMLLGVCLLDLALIAVHLSWPGDAASSQQQRLQQQHHQLRELLLRKANLAQEVEDSTRQLQDLMAAQEARAVAEAEQMRFLAQGMDDLEQGLAGLLRARASRTRGLQNETHTGLVT